MTILICICLAVCGLTILVMQAKNIIDWSSIVSVNESFTMISSCSSCLMPELVEFVNNDLFKLLSDCGVDLYGHLSDFGAVGFKLAELRVGFSFLLSARTCGCLMPEFVDCEASG
ncbi:hypothetical protein BpHYR1_031081 [Brachionus plicatilis]|uniref:Uncharacterized protein n=1 Tax=Brachionus plicatilis TaxID=10195 RepID=A0A3M7RHW7_BRAPC|nr:hypothetical protein BpHYR1_031081 [Brachionus plicatilis]